MSLGYIHPEARGATRSQSRVHERVNESVRPIPVACAKTKPLLFFLLSSLAIATQLALGVTHIPSDVLINFANYGRDVKILLVAMSEYFRSNAAFALLAWLLPIVPAGLLPLKFTTVPLGFAALVASTVMLGSFLSPLECTRFVEMLRTVPELGYMWYETLTISVVATIVNPTAFVVLWCGPVATVCLGQNDTMRPWSLFAVVAALSIALVLPTVHIFVDEDGEFFLRGYSTESLAGSILSVGFIFIWIRTYHLVCRDSYLTWRRAEHTRQRVAAVIWALLGTALVETWVSSAYALHFAYVSLMQIEPEAGFVEWLLTFPAVRRALTRPPPA